MLITHIFFVLHQFNDYFRSFICVLLEANTNDPSHTDMENTFILNITRCL